MNGKEGSQLPGSLTTRLDCYDNIALCVHRFVFHKLYISFFCHENRVYTLLCSSQFSCTVEQVSSTFWWLQTTKIHFLLAWHILHYYLGSQLTQGSKLMQEPAFWNVTALGQKTQQLFNFLITFHCISLDHFLVKFCHRQEGIKVGMFVNRPILLKRST